MSKRKKIDEIKQRPQSAFLTLNGLEFTPGPNNI